MNLSSIHLTGSLFDCVSYHKCYTTVLAGCQRLQVQLSKVAIATNSCFMAYSRAFNHACVLHRSFVRRPIIGPISSWAMFWRGCKIIDRPPDLPATFLSAGKIRGLPQASRIWPQNIRGPGSSDASECPWISALRTVVPRFWGMQGNVLYLHGSQLQFLNLLAHYEFMYHIHSAT